MQPDNMKQELLKIQSTILDLYMHQVVWNGKDEGGKACGSGVYFYRLRTSEISVTKKMLLLK